MVCEPVLDSCPHGVTKKCCGCSGWTGVHHVTNVCQRFLCKGNLLRVIVLNVKTVCKALLQLRHLIGLVDNNKVVVVLVKGHPFELTTVSILKMIFKATIISLAKKDIEIQPGFEPGSSEFQSDATHASCNSANKNTFQHNHIAAWRHFCVYEKFYQVL